MKEELESDKFGPGTWTGQTAYNAINYNYINDYYIRFVWGTLEALCEYCSVRFCKSVYSITST